jgi:hypothetical protein
VLAAAAAIVLMAGWAGYTRYALNKTTLELQRLEAENKIAEGTAAAATKLTAQGKKTVTTAAALQQHATNRFLFAPTLNALQEVVLEEIQVVQLSLLQNVQYVPPVKAGNKSTTGRTPAKKGYLMERISLAIQAKNFADPKVGDAFMDQIASQDYFKRALRSVNPVILKSRLPRQVDPLNPSTVYTLFTIECSYPERILGYE